MTLSELAWHENLGGDLRMRRETMGLSLRQLEALLGGELTAAGVNRIELGQRLPNVRTLALLSRTLGVVFVVGPKGIAVLDV